MNAGFLCTKFENLACLHMDLTVLLFSENLYDMSARILIGFYSDICKCSQSTIKWRPTRGEKYDLSISVNILEDFMLAFYIL